MSAILRYAAVFLLSSSGLLPAQAPRWGLLGDDESLESTFDDAARVALVCIYETELRNVKPPFAQVVHHATVVESHKGELKVGEKVQIAFRTDSLPAGEGERREYVENAAKRSKGALRFAFLHGSGGGMQVCEFMDLPSYSTAMHEFLRTLQLRPGKSQAEQE